MTVMKKIIVIALLVAFILLIAAIAIAIIPIIATLVSNRETQISQEPRAANLAVTTPVPTSITIQQDSIVPPTSNLTTAKKVLEWTSSQKSSSGVYLSGILCHITRDGQQKCSVPIEDPKVAVHVMWARFKYFQATGDRNQLDAINQDLETFTGLYQNPSNTISYQINHPTCTLLYDLWQTDEFTSDQKQKMQDLCSKSTFPGAEVDEINQEIANRVIPPEMDTGSVIRGEKLPYRGIVNIEDFRNGYYKYAISASDMISQYLWLNKTAQLTVAKQLVDKATQIFSNEKEGKLVNQASMVLGASIVDLYIATKDQKYLDFAKYLAQVQESRLCQNTEECSYHLYFLDKLFKVTQDLRYRDAINNLISYLKNTAFDDQTGAFQSMIPKVVSFETRNNSLLAGIISQY